MPKLGRKPEFWHEPVSVEFPEKKTQRKDFAEKTVEILLRENVALCPCTCDNKDTAYTNAQYLRDYARDHGCPVEYAIVENDDGRFAVVVRRKREEEAEAA